MNFFPELAGIGRYSGEMAAWLHAQGHEVRVIAAPPSFPDWTVFEGYSAWAYRKSDCNGVTVWRSPTWVPAKPGALARMVHLASFMLSSFPLLIGQWRWKPDLVFVVEPPLFCAPGALVLSRLAGSRAWLHVQDHEVDAAFEMGLLRGSSARRFAVAVERWLLNRFDRVSSISAAMVARTRNKGVDEERLVLFPNWVDISAIRPQPRSLEAAGYRLELGIPAEAVVVLYAGSMGRKQGIELLAEAARLLSDDTRVHFVFCGNGPSRETLRASCEGLQRAHFLDLQPAERLSELLGMADIQVLPQRADAADLVMPSKLTGMLASGRAVLVTAHLHTELGNVVGRCGVVVPPGDASALAAAISQLADDPERRAALGAAGRAFAESELDQHIVLGQLEREFERCLAGTRSARPLTTTH